MFCEQMIKLITFHEIEWNYTGEKKRNADSRENKNEHAGW